MKMGLTPSTWSACSSKIVIEFANPPFPLFPQAPGEVANRLVIELQPEEAIKLQLFRADLLLSRGACLAGYQEAAGVDTARGLLTPLELSPESIARVADCAS